MNGRNLMMLVFLGVSGIPAARADDAASAAPKKPLACSLGGLTSKERVESQGLLKTLETSVLEVKELPDGYALRVDEAKLPFGRLSRWIELERRCCPFFHFATEVSPDGGPVWLRL